ncbi:MAG: winged helix-turn-helix domain-containing protein [Rhizobiaceae bacterium]|nr:winged helix-turn-helix domain-containing protein [Rhizobiaceae bacterium]
MGENQKSILVVDDDQQIRRLLRNCFEPEGYLVFEAENSAETEKCLAENDIDLITLDLNLGPENGLTIASVLKAKSDIPIIIVTGKGDVIDRVVGLEMGADDYISKPFHVREVIARVRTVLRRSGKALHQSPNFGEVATDESLVGVSSFKFDKWLANFETFELKSQGGVPSDLTTADFKLLKVLLENPKKVLSREQIMDQINGHDWAPYDRTIDNQIARLRKKLEEDPANPKLIKTVRGIGYTFTADVAKI